MKQKMVYIILLMILSSFLFAAEWGESKAVTSFTGFPFKSITAAATAAATEAGDDRTWYFSGTQVTIYDPKTKTFSEPIDMVSKGYPLKSIDASFKYRDGDRTFYSDGTSYTVYSGSDKSWSKVATIASLKGMPFKTITTAFTSQDQDDPRTWYISGTLVTIYDPDTKSFSDPIDLAKKGCPFKSIKAAFRYRDNKRTFYSDGSKYIIYESAVAVDEKEKTATSGWSANKGVAEFTGMPFKSITAAATAAATEAGDDRTWYFSGTKVTIYDPKTKTFSEVIDMASKGYPLKSIEASFKYRDGDRTFYSDGTSYTFYSGKDKSWAPVAAIASLKGMPFKTITTAFTSQNPDDPRTWYISGTLVTIYDPDDKSFTTPIDLAKKGCPFKSITAAFRYRDNKRTFYSDGVNYSIYE